MHGEREIEIKTLESFLLIVSTKFFKKAGAFRLWPVMQKPLLNSLDIVTEAEILGSDLAGHSRIQIF